MKHSSEKQTTQSTDNRLALKPSRGLTQQGAELAVALRTSILRLERNIRRQTRTNGRSAIELHLLQTLDQYPGSTQSGLAELEQVTRPSIGPHIRKLIKMGYIKAMSVKKMPGRPAHLYITRAGRIFLRNTAKPNRDWLTQRLVTLKSEEHKHLLRAIESFQLLVRQEDVAEPKP